MKNTTLSLTEGPIVSNILRFALPLFLANLFQQLYNMVDALIVGNYLGNAALAAVSSSGSLIILLVGFFNGIAVGAGVIIARYYGAGQMTELKRAIHTTISFGLLCGLALTLIGLLATPFLLQWMKTPSDILPESILYFRVYFLGSLAFVLYNHFVGILQAVGDSKHPLYYLILSSILNVCLDFLLIGVFHFGVGAAALATVLSQLVSALLCLYRLIRKSPEAYRVSFHELNLDRFMLKQIVSNGVPTGGQTSIISIANVFVQSNFNAFGSLAVAGCGIYSKLEGFAFLPVTSFSLALTTFISQNLGAGRYDRVKKGGFFAVLAGTGLSELLGVLQFLLIPALSRLFTHDGEVIAYAVREAHVSPLFFFLCAFSHCVSGLLRGAGKSAVPMYIMLAFWCGVRVTYISIIVRFFPVIESVFWAYPLTWTLSTLVFSYYLFRTDWIHGYSKKLSP